MGSSAVRKVVINCNYGGFGLSTRAIQRLYKLNSKYVKRVSLDEFFEGDKFHRTTESRRAWAKRVGRPIIGNDILELLESYSPEFRGDSLVIKVVEELGESAWGEHAQLKIVEIPADISYIIQEYDNGIEWVAEAHRTWS